MENILYSSHCLVFLADTEEPWLPLSPPGVQLTYSALSGFPESLQLPLLFLSLLPCPPWVPVLGWASLWPFPKSQLFCCVPCLDWDLRASPQSLSREVLLFCDSGTTSLWWVAPNEVGRPGASKSSSLSEPFCLQKGEASLKLPATSISAAEGPLLNNFFDLQFFNFTTRLSGH